MIPGENLYRQSLALNFTIQVSLLDAFRNFSKKRAYYSLSECLYLVNCKTGRGFHVLTFVTLARCVSLDQLSFKQRVTQNEELVSLF